MCRRAAKASLFTFIVIMSGSLYNDTTYDCIIFSVCYFQVGLRIFYKVFSFQSKVILYFFLISFLLNFPPLNFLRHVIVIIYQRAQEHKFCGRLNPMLSYFQVSFLILRY